MADDHHDHDLSVAAGHVVSNALQHTRNLFCPFCAGSFLFEFTLKDHLKAAHRDEITKQHLLRSDHTGDGDAGADDFLSLSMQLCQHTCPFCNAAFNHLGLIPKHISDYHGSELLQLWQQQTGNAERLQAARAHEPSILYAACSPGLSAIFKQMDTDDTTRNPLTAATSPKLKSILKKTPSKGGRTHVPASPQLAPGVTIRRSKSDVVKRSLSVRRELRFDPATKRSPLSAAVAALSPRIAIKKKSSSFKLLRNPFRFARNSAAASAPTVGGKSTMASNQLITSTPIGLLDDVGAVDARGRSQLDNWKASVRNVAATSPHSRHRQLSARHCVGRDAAGAGDCDAGADGQRYQCAHCKRAWSNNADLLLHLREQHRGIKHWLRPQYGCTACGSTFYSNNHLIRHCHVEHGVATRATLLGRNYSVR